jgi:hypothetical protein
VFRRNEDWLGALLIGRRLGLNCQHCDVCGKGVMTRGSPRCKMTPKCPGHHRSSSTAESRGCSASASSRRPSPDEWDEPWTLGGV